MPKRKDKQLDHKEQSKRFIEKAKEIGADKDRVDVDEVMRRLAGQKRRKGPQARSGG